MFDISGCKAVPLNGGGMVKLHIIFVMIVVGFLFGVWKSCLICKANKQKL